MTIECEITRYSVVGDEVVETTTTEVVECYVGPTESVIYAAKDGIGSARRISDDAYLSLGNCAASIKLENLYDHARSGRGWCAQAGTKPVKIECQADGRYMECCGPRGCQAGWGGRNYPRIYVTHEALERALEEIHEQSI